MNISNQADTGRHNRFFPFLAWFHLVNASTLKNDLYAGLTNAAIVLPQGVAFAMIAGLPPEYGLYTAIVPPIVAGLFGSSLHLISGPTTAISIVVFSTISQHAEPGSARFIELALTLTFLAGVMQFALGAIRMGALINFISHSVVVGFTAGAAILIATSQLKHILGVEIPAGESFLHTWLDIYKQAGDANLCAITVAAVTMAMVIAFKVFRPKWPAMLIAMVAGALTSLGLGAEECGISLVGAIPSSLPPFSTPDFSVGAVKVMTSGALAVSMLGLIEAVSIARSIATKSKQTIHGNQEFIGQGLANMVGSFFSCYASSGSFTRSGVNYASGAKTPLAAVFAALSLALVILLIAPLAAYLPIPAMGGIVLIVAYNIIDFHHIRVILKASREETAVMATTFFSTLFLELEFAIYAGVMLSLILYLYRTSRPRIVSRTPNPETYNRSFHTDPDAPECPQFKIIRVDGSIYFGSVAHVEKTLRWIDREEPEQVHVLLVCSGVNFIDVAGAEMLAHEAERRRKKGGGLYLYGVKEPALEILRRGGYMKTIGEKNIFTSKHEALTTIISSRLDPGRCPRCDARVFTECAALPAETAQESKG